MIDGKEKSGIAPITAVMERAQVAAENWRNTPLDNRLIPFQGLKNILIENTDQIVDSLSRATGKPTVEALSSDILVCVSMLDYYAKNAKAILAEKRRPGIGFYRLSSFRVRYEPYGVVVVIAPWNHPLQLALVPLASALVAGNSVILKPSEITPGIGELIGELIVEAGFPEGVVQVILGDGIVGQKLIAAKPDFVFFTGSLNTGRSVMEAAARHPIPVHLELGGKDPMIVFADANLPRAAKGAVWAAFAHAGQNCVSVERLYVEQSVHDQFLNLVLQEAEKLRVGSGMEMDFGPLIRPEQRNFLEGQIQEAVSAGARIIVNPERAGNLMGPVILANVNHKMRIMQEESFGPILPIMAFDDESEALQLANDSKYGLNASVWTSDKYRGRRVAEKLNAGNVAINDVLKNIGNPSTPFGGVKQSGFGRYHGPEGLKTFCNTKTIMSNPELLEKEPNWFPYGKRVYENLKTLIHTFYSDAPKLKKLGKLAKGFGGNLLGKQKD